MQIRIKSTPPGEAPEQVRRAWIGLVIPVPPKYASRRTRPGAGVLTGPRGFLGHLFAIFTGRIQGMDGYIVESKVALELLAAQSPEAAAWWQQNTPRFFEPGRHFIFAAESCEEIL